MSGMIRIIDLDRDEQGNLLDPDTGGPLILRIKVNGELKEIPAIYFPDEKNFLNGGEEYRGKSEQDSLHG